MPRKFALCAGYTDIRTKKEEKGGRMMDRNTKNMAKGAALGVMAGAAMGAAGMYAAEKSPKELKKAVKKAAHTRCV